MGDTGRHTRGKQQHRQPKRESIRCVRDNVPCQYSHFDNCCLTPLHVGSPCRTLHYQQSNSGQPHKNSLSTSWRQPGYISQFVLRCAERHAAWPRFSPMPNGPFLRDRQRMGKGAFPTSRRTCGGASLPRAATRTRHSEPLDARACAPRPASCTSGWRQGREAAVCGPSPRTDARVN